MKLTTFLAETSTSKRQTSRSQQNKTLHRAKGSVWVCGARPDGVVPRNTLTRVARPATMPNKAPPRKRRIAVLGYPAVVSALSHSCRLSPRKGCFAILCDASCAGSRRYLVGRHGDMYSVVMRGDCAQRFGRGVCMRGSLTLRPQPWTRAVHLVVTLCVNLWMVGALSSLPQMSQTSCSKRILCSIIVGADRSPVAIIPCSQ